MSTDDEREARRLERERQRARRAESPPQRATGRRGPAPSAAPRSRPSTDRNASSSRRRGPSPALLAIVVGVVLLGIVAGLTLGGGSDDAPAQRAAVRTRRVAHSAAGATTTSSSASAAHGTTTHTPVNADAPGGSADPRKPAAWPLAGARARAKAVPILMYHLVAAAPAGTAYPGLWVPPEQLTQHVAALASAGFTGVTLAEVWSAWHGHGHLPAHPVVLSFDDGDISQVLGAGPVLKAAGWPGTLNLAVSHLGKGGIPTWGARRLIAQGWEVDSHTIDHLDVTTLGAAQLHHELSGSRVAIQHKLGVTPKFFCYPAGRNDAASQAAVKAAGYLAATTVDAGLATSTGDAFTLPRIRVQPSTSGPTLVAQASGRAAAPGGTGE